MKINGERLWRRLEILSEFTEPDRPWTRRAFTEYYAKGREWLEQEMLDAGLETRIDTGGNLIGFLPGKDPALSPIVTGSHSDTVPNGGRYDGILGVIAGLEVLQSIRESGVIPQHGMEVIDFLSEEPSDYGVSCIGSRAMVGRLNDELLTYTDPTGETLSEGIVRVGGEPCKISLNARQPGDVACFVEMHIEQGRLLETHQIPIGIVTHIVGIRRYDITIIGQADHAGTTPMDLRRDAMVGASRIIAEINRRARQVSDKEYYLVATVGHVDVTPNAPNAIPSSVRLVVEVRSDNHHVMENFLPPILSWAECDVCRENALTLDVRTLSEGAPTACAEMIQDEIEAASIACGKSSLKMPSGAGHDAVYMANIAPVGMIFTPCLNGRSHCMEEWLDPEQATNGTEVLAETMIRLDRRLIMTEDNN